MSYRRNDDLGFYGVLLFIFAIIVTVIIFKIKAFTGLSFETMKDVGANWLLFGLGIIGIKLFTEISLLSYWNFIFAAFWLTLLPSLNEWGGLEPMPEGFAFFNQHIEPTWYAQTFWQYIIAALIASSRYIHIWIKDNFFN